MRVIVRIRSQRLTQRLLDAIHLVLVLPSVLALDVALRRLGYRRTVRALENFVAPRSEARGFDPERDSLTRHLVRGLVLTERVIRSGAMCLSRSLALWGWLRAHGIEATVQFGVRLSESGLLAHAWVEHEGRPLFESIGEPDQAFERLERSE